MAEQQADLRERVRQVQEAERALHQSQRALAEREAEMDMGERHLNVRACHSAPALLLSPIARFTTAGHMDGWITRWYLHCTQPFLLFWCSLCLVCIACCQANNEMEGMVACLAVAVTGALEL